MSRPKVKPLSSATDSARRSTPTTKDETTKSKSMSYLTIIIGICCLFIACYLGYKGYLETRINTPFDNQKMVQFNGLFDQEKYWGTYRPGVYFSLKTRDPSSIVTGLMWYSPKNLKADGAGLRHYCDIGDNLNSYGWTHHDGKIFGSQTIRDGNFQIETSFIKFLGGNFGGNWTSRISVTPLNESLDEEISLIWYTAMDEKTDGWINYDDRLDSSKVYGHSKTLGNFVMKFENAAGKIMKKSYLTTTIPNLLATKNVVLENLRVAMDKKSKQKHIVLVDNSNNDMETNFIATQLTVVPPFSIDITYQSVQNFLENDIVKATSGDQYTTALSAKKKEFEEIFEKKYHLKEKGFSAPEIVFARNALSNMLGSIGYFYGSSKVQSKYTKDSVPYWKAPLYTTVPSRSFFPRGFLWDEGFHGLLISTWDIDIELDIINHWFDLMNVEGWIPREQILGIEALAKVPEEFVVQYNTNANPPTFFLVLHNLLQRKDITKNYRLSNLDRLYTRLQAWFTWYNTTQIGDIPGTYRWRGRNENNTKELNPKTLTSGLDDFPRASHPTNNERHIDLRCWIAFAAGVMADLSRILGRNSAKYEETRDYLYDNSLLNELHLSQSTKTYADWGLHSDSVILKRPQQQPDTDMYHQHQPLDKIRVTLKKPKYQFADSSFGYVSLFPFLLKIVDHNSYALGKILENIRDPSILWSNYGLRSLSRSSPLYMKRNTEHDPPYWRGQIWININYLALRSLHYYGNIAGPYKDEALQIYKDLRKNVIQNIFKQYNDSGYIWEQYNDDTGLGSGCRPFTGWSALVVLIMAEQY